MYEMFYLSGDEDTGVNLYCRKCNHRGRPVAYYVGIAPAWHDDSEIVEVYTLADLLEAAHTHAARNTHIV